MVIGDNDVDRYGDAFDGLMHHRQSAKVTFGSNQRRVKLTEPFRLGAAAIRTETIRRSMVTTRLR